MVAALLGTPGRADTLPSVYVVASGDASALNQCDLSASSSAATAEAAFRYNHVPVAQRAEYMKDKAIEFAIDLNAFEITRESGTGTGSCAADIIVYLGNYTRTYDPVNNNVKWATVHYCDNSTLFVLKKFGAQTSLNDYITQTVNECISEYQKIQVVK